MVYYEPIKPMRLYKEHEIRDMEIISEKPMFADSPWMKVTTAEGRSFYITMKTLKEMNKFPGFYPTEERSSYGSFAPAQEDKKKAVPVGEPTPLTA